MSELVDGERYIVKSGKHWGIYIFRHQSREWADNLLFAYAGDGVVVPDECEQIIPLELAIRAAELRDENERLRAVNAQMVAFIVDHTGSCPADLDAEMINMEVWGCDAICCETTPKQCWRKYFEQAALAAAEGGA